MPELKVLKKLLEERQLPDVWGAPSHASDYDGNIVFKNKAEVAAAWKEKRAEILDLLSREEYGYLPPAVASEAKITAEEATCAGKATFRRVELTLHCPKGDYVLPFDLVMPAGIRKVPMFICINFRPGTPDKYVPMEEITDAGYGFANVFYKDITDDSAKEDGVYPLFDRDENTGYGKISLWAWGVSRICDWLYTLDNVDKNRIAVCGHSRLGKTALWCGANDERLSVAFSNDSGCAGAAIYRGKTGEGIKDISKNFPYWFCRNYFSYVDGTRPLPFDQHFLIALMAPRSVYVASAELDSWADPYSEFLSCVEAGKVFEAFGISGLKTPDRLPEVGESLHQGNIGYHLRYGSHYFSREDWNNYFRFRNRHGV